MTVAAFKGWATRKIIIPNGDELVCYHFRADGAYTSQYNVNHNVFRLNAKGEVMWQVQRDEGVWTRLAKQMRAYECGKFLDLVVRDPEFKELKRLYETGRLSESELSSGLSMPFLYLWPVHSDGTVEKLPNGMQKETDISWQPGDTVHLSALDGFRYILDIETGIAKNVTPKGHRRW